MRTFLIQNDSRPRCLNRPNDLFGHAGASPKHGVPAADRDSVDPMSLLVAGGAMSAAAVGVARRRRRGGRVRREPIDVQQLAAEFGEPPKRTEQEIIAALEAEVQRAHRARAGGRSGARGSPSCS